MNHKFTTEVTESTEVSRRDARILNAEAAEGAEVTQLMLSCDSSATSAFHFFSVHFTSTLPLQLSSVPSVSSVVNRCDSVFSNRRFDLGGESQRGGEINAEDAEETQ